MNMLSLAEINARVDAWTHKNNKAFEKASLARKRVLILEDALKQLEAKKYVATSGTYFRLNLAADDVLLPLHHVPTDTQLSALVDMPGATCNVCAVGGVFASLVRFKDRLSLRTAGLLRHGEVCWSDFGKYTEEVFPHALLVAMENAFEYNSYGYDFKTSTRALKAIYGNIIKNKGAKFTTHRRSAVRGIVVIWPVVL